MPDSVDNKAQYEALFNHATIGIAVTNRRGEIVNFNRFAENQFGYLKEEVLGKQVEFLIPASYHAAHRAHREHFYNHPAHRQMGAGRDLHALRKDGTVFPVEVSISAYEVNREMFVLVFIIDITIRKNDEEVVLRQRDELEKVTRQVKQLNAELERKVDDRTRMLKETLAELERSKEELSEALATEKQLSDLKSRFITMASHEFRTPLSTILSSTFLIEQYIRTGTPEKGEKHLKRIKGAVSGLRSILEDFLSLGKLDEGVVQARPEVLNTDEVVAEIEELIAEIGQIVKAGQTIRFNCTGTHPILGDMQLIRNILINLLSNAIKFSKENAPIEILAFFGIDGLSLTVKDEGIGISEEDQQFLSERFFRAKNATNIQGTGLGLHIVVKYLELMGGSLEFKSRLGEGSAFTVRLPPAGTDRPESFEQIKNTDEKDSDN